MKVRNLLSILFLGLAFTGWTAFSSENITSTPNIEQVIQENIKNAVIAMQEKRYDDAIGLVRMNQTLEPEHFNHVRQKAWIYGMWGVRLKREEGIGAAKSLFKKAIERYDQSIELALRAKEDNTILVALHQQKALLAMDFGDYELSYSTLLRALLFRLDDPVTNYLLGIYQRERYTKLIIEGRQTPDELIAESNHYFEKAVKYNGESFLIPYAYFFVGLKQYQEGNYEDSLQNLQMWLSQIQEEKGNNLNPNDIDLISITNEMIDHIRQIQATQQ